MPKEATFPLEIAELIGLKMCDDYTLSYFVTNDSLDGRESYNHGMIVQEKDKKGIKSKNAINYYSSGIKNNNSYVDKILYLDTVFIDKKKNFRQINVNNYSVEYNDAMYRSDSFFLDRKKENFIISVQENNGVIIKKWQVNDKAFKHTIVLKGNHKIFEVTEKISESSKDSIYYRYNDLGRLTGKKYFIRVHPDSLYLLTKKYDYFYDKNNRIERIKEDERYLGYQVIYKSDKKLIVESPILTGHNYSGIRIEYFLNDSGALVNYKHLQFSVNSRSTYSKREYSGGNKDEYMEETIISDPKLKSSGIILCN